MMMSCCWTMRTICMYVCVYVRMYVYLKIRARCSDRTITWMTTTNCWSCVMMMTMSSKTKSCCCLMTCVYAQVTAKIQSCVWHVYMCVCVCVCVCVCEVRAPPQIHDFLCVRGIFARRSTQNVEIRLHLYMSLSFFFPIGTVPACILCTSVEHNVASWYNHVPNRMPSRIACQCSHMILQTDKVCSVKPYT
jgi:hypothetical protein